MFYIPNKSTYWQRRALRQEVKRARHCNAVINVKFIGHHGKDWKRHGICRGCRREIRPLQTTTKLMDFHQLQESWMDTIHGRHRVRFRSDHHIFTNIILMADKQNITKGMMHSNCRLLPEDIVCKITQRNNIRRANTRDPALKLLNEGITSDIQKHKQNIWKEHLDAHWDHRHNTNTL